MKSCTWKGGAAYSRRGLAQADLYARKLDSHKVQGVFMKRWKFRHRFTLLLCALIFFLLAPDGSANPQQLSQDNTPQPSAQLPPRHEIPPLVTRSEEHTSELQSHHDLVCRLLLEKKKTIHQHHSRH